MLTSRKIVTSSGEPKYAGLFNGSSSTIDFGYPSALQVGTGDFSIWYWWKRKTNDDSGYPFTLGGFEQNGIWGSIEATGQAAEFHHDSSGTESVGFAGEVDDTGWYLYSTNRGVSADDHIHVCLGKWPQFGRGSANLTLSAGDNDFTSSHANKKLLWGALQGAGGVSGYMEGYLGSFAILKGGANVSITGNDYTPIVKAGPFANPMSTMNRALSATQIAAIQLAGSWEDGRLVDKSSNALSYTATDIEIADLR